MKVKTSIVLLAAGVVSLLALGRPNLADADWRSRQKNLDRAAARQTNNNRAELYRDRAEYRRDVGELERDKADLRRLYRSGASRGDIVRKHAEIRQDLGEIVQDRREIRDDFGAVRRDQYNSGWGNYGRYDNRDRWSSNDRSWWGWGNNRPTNYGRWDYGRD
jgi:hypothetical protein